MTGSELAVNGVELWVDTVGDRRDPAIVLIGGASSAMDWWEDEFCQRLAAGRRFVIRYDSRDTGQSVSYPAGAPAYTGADLAADVVGILDGLGVPSAHLVGLSMGGALAQRVAVDAPGRVDSLTLIATTLGLSGGPEFAELPPSSEELRAYFADPPPDPDWSDPAVVVDHLVDLDRRFSAPDHFDEARVRRIAEQVVARSRDMAASLTNHGRLAEGEPPRGSMADLDTPTLVIHGTADPLFPFGHAEALADAITGAELLPLPAVGHQMPPPEVWPVVVPAILRHTSGGWDAQADRLAARSYARGDPTGWFDQLYAAGVAGEVAMPWDRADPHPLLEQWVGAHEPRGAGRRAVVVGCGLGADAEYATRLGYDTVAFDISETAVAQARQRNPGSPVRYTTGDLFELPTEWVGGFDLVIEIHTVQALPDAVRRTAISQVGRLVAPGGTLVVIAFRHVGSGPDRARAAPAGPPFPLTRAEIDAFTADGLEPVRVDETADPRRPESPRWLAVFRRPA